MVPRKRARTDDGLEDSAALPSAGEPGDLAKRVSRRRQDLKLSRRQLAGLASPDRTQRVPAKATQNLDFENENSAAT